MRRRRSRALAVLAVLGCLAGGAAVIPAAVGPHRPAGAAADPPQAAGAAAHESADCAPDPAVPKRQLRAMWIASVTNIDWPSQPGLSADEQKQEFLDWLDLAEERRLNAVVVQVRPTADAFWPSPYEPWSKWLTGTQGEDPGYDPLAFAVREAHARNLELHAWFNPYRVTMDDDLDELAPDHPAREHPEWLVFYGGRYYYNPGIPEVRRFVENAILDAVERYDIDAVHFDDYFYPYPVEGEEFDDQEAYERYGEGFDDKADWRRHNVDLLISELGRRIKETKPWVEFGVSPFAVWRNNGTDPEGSATTAGVETYDDLYADTRRWVREEWIDYIVPQVYWNIGFEAADYAELVRWWSEQVRGTHVRLYIGQATYKVADPAQNEAWHDPNEMSAHLHVNRDHPEVRGDIYFSAVQVRANRLGHMDIVMDEHYTRPALVPTVPTWEAPTPRRPVLHAVETGEDGNRLVWTDAQPPARRATAYAIYRFDGRVTPDACAFADAAHLLATVRGNGEVRQSFTDTGADPDRTYTYVVTALDRGHQESAPSRPHTSGR